MPAELEDPIATVRVRRQRRAGDVEAIVDLHRRLYLPVYGLDESFVAGVEAALREAAGRGWPGEREAIWIVEHQGEVAGALGLTDEGGGEARLRWVLLAPELRGHGLGRRLVTEAVELARAAGYELIALETFSELRTAAAIYRSLGFELVSEHIGPKWGREEVNFQRYELRL